jgi:endonuclease-3 related protein
LADYFICNENLEELFKKKKEELRKEFLSLKGIGNETADSIMLYSAEKPLFVIDAYTKRIFSRILGINENKYDYWQERFMESFSVNDDRLSIFKEYHSLIVRHGKELCRTVPLCKNCFLKMKCDYGKK